METTLWAEGVLDVERLALEYQSRQPFPHVVLDNFLISAAAWKIVDELPQEWPSSWVGRNDYYQSQRWSKGRGLLGPVTNAFIDQLHDKRFLTFLTKMTGIPGLNGDPGLVGGCIHEMERDGYLSIHRESNKYNHQDRRVCLILNITPYWDEVWGGNLELWNEDVTRRVRAITHVFNRAVIFDTGEYAFHGVPVPLRCPSGDSFWNLILYYYTKGVREDQVNDRFRFEYVDTEWKVPQRTVKYQ